MPNKNTLCTHRALTTPCLEAATRIQVQTDTAAGMSEFASPAPTRTHSTGRRRPTLHSATFVQTEKFHPSQPHDPKQSLSIKCHVSHRNCPEVRLDNLDSNPTYCWHPQLFLALEQTSFAPADRTLCSRCFASC